ncbi:uncharacterized protein VICG_01246 [Vittaforma corneae ATCC 50505]|uniref:Flavodoxin-like domain-containing protein n=1 Tax=Vittaforma corneae (strain ATCC 50505) TaxID=993615 RepID=L2GN59_VITCO|nr:uncharacterized protein VICG_01246 [Vittaforma corneae ATCC 50505]ELA41742.1 hypothetical protein VICG_01246 [Vittaforma corneae ATCC 50505]
MVPILIGSQTGNGLHLAKLLNKEIPNTFTLAINEFDILKINEFPFIIFIMSTHGDGQCPFNMSRMYNLLVSQGAKKHNKDSLLFNFKFAMLGLGDSSYQKYNYCARICSEKMQHLGAKCIVQELCDSQDPNGMYDGYRRFKESIAAIYSSELCSNLTGESVKNENIKKYKAKIVSNRELTPQGYEHMVYEIIFDIPEYIDFYPGDCLSIVPENTIDLREYFNFPDNQIEFLRKNIDFFATVQQTSFIELSSFTDSDVFREKLLEISQDYDLYYDYVIIPRRNIIEIIEDFKLGVTFDFLKGLNSIYPRYFSCTMTQEQGNGESRARYHVLYNIVRYKTYLDKERLGLCSQYLTTLAPGDCINIGVTRSSLFFEEKNLLFFATGTGVTLPRSVIHFFKHKTVKIFYGFRYYDKDQLCKEEFSENVDITYVASRDEKKYIMDAYRESPVDNIDSWLVFASGNCRINRSVHQVLKDVHGKDVVFQSETW